MLVPQAAPPLRIARFQPAIDAAIASVLSGPSYILGAPVEAFEAEFAAYLGVGHCVGVGSGTDALVIALKALGIGPGDEVITVALTAAGTAQAVRLSGADLRFVDVDPQSRCIDPAAVEAAIGPRTKAILPVHLHGVPADMIRICAIAARHGLAVVEDCAQAHGATIGGGRVGSFGDAAAFSFYPTKNLGGVGDGGAVVCRDAALAARMRSLRSYGWDGDDRISRRIAGNSRLDTLQAAILTALLPHLAAGNAERRQIAADFAAGLEDTGFGLPIDIDGAVHHQFAVTCDDRDAVRRRLASDHGIGTAVHYHPPLHQHPAFQVGPPPSLPVTEALSRRMISLPIQPEVALRHRARIIAALRIVAADFFRRG